jgi:outer membrane usher protein
MAGLFVTFARAQQIPRIEPALSQNADMRLDVFVNGRSLQLIIAATRLANARIAVARSELEEVGIKAPGNGARDEQIDLDGAGLRYRYDEAGQRIYFDLSDEQRMPKIYDGRGERPAPPPAMSAWGALINYSTFASASSKLGRFAPDLNGVNASIDARLFSP